MSTGKMRNGIGWLVLGLGLLVSVSWAQEAEFTEPGWLRSAEKTNSGPPVIEWSEGQAQEEGVEPAPEVEAQSLEDAAVSAEAITPEIEALARGLEGDPERIFNYVRDRIRYVHYFGSKKGAQLTLLERSGNDFDQCALLVALLRAAGHTASYRFGTVSMAYERTSHRDFKHWVGLTKANTNWNETISFVANLNDYRGFPFPLGTFIDDENDLVFHRVWVRLTWEGSVYSLDPAFKVHEPIAGIDLTNAMSLSSNAVWTAAGGTGNANLVELLNEANLRNKLRDYTTNLLAHLQSNQPNASVEEILGGQYIASGQTFGFSLPFTPYVWEDTSPALNWDHIPTNLMTTLRISVDTTTNRLLYMPQLQGQRLSLTFSNNGVAQLWLEDELLLQKQTSGGSTVPVALSVNHPHGSWDFTNNVFINANWNDHSVTNTYQRTNASYAIIYAFEPDQTWLHQRQEKLDAYRQRLPDTSREVITETLNVMGLNWLLQTERIPRVMAAQRAMLLQHHHRFGRMAQEAGQGYYIDVYQQLSGNYPASGNGSSDIARSDRVFDLASYFASAAEHGLIEQLQSSNLVAASTVKMLQIGNTNGQRTYLLNGVSSWLAFQDNLSNYDKNFLRTNYIDKGYTLLLPANGANALAGGGSWSGYGLVARGVITTAQGTVRDMVMLIKGGYHGGYAAYSDSSLDPVFINQSGYFQPFYFDPVPPLVGSPFGADPVSMADGSFHLSATDLSLGQAEPRGLSFTRHYSSSRRHHSLAGMSPGWVHNYHLKAAEISAPLASLGDTTPQQMAPLIVATVAAMEFYGTAGHAKNWAVTSLIAKWGVDQLINNAVSISLGKDTVQFIKQPNGTFTPPAGSTMTLLKTNGVYWLRERHGNTFKFNQTGVLTNIVDQYNQNLTLTYTASNWVATVKDWKNRQLTFNYTGTPSRLTSVSDNISPARTVSYGYTGSGAQFDLTSVTDAESKTNTFLYDTNHQIIVTKDALNRIVVSNRYDGFGRVIEQYSQGDTNQAWQLYWSGFVNTEEDPAGGRTRYFYDAKHRLITQRNALGHYTDWFFDGQDHIESFVRNLGEPGEEWTDYYYDARHNPTAIQDPLGHWKDLFYDAQDNLDWVWDERRNTNRFGYNAKFQLTAQTNGAGDWITFGYDATTGLLTGRTNAGGVTAYAYDANGFLNRIIHPGNLGSEGFLNHARGDVLSHTNARTFVTSFQYNQRRELTNTIAPTNVTSQVAYDAVGNVSITADARGFKSTNYWSATRKLTGTTLPATPQGVPAMTNVYDNRDWLLRTTNTLQKAAFYTNDPAQRLVSVTDPLLRTTRFGYDNSNRKTATTNAANEVTRQLWNQRGELLQTTDAANRIVKRKYDEAGNQTLLTNRNEKKWQFHYDAANRLTNTITPLGRETRLTYNNRGLVSTVREPSTQTATHYYDAKGRLTNLTDAVGTRWFYYDANDNLTLLTNVNQASRLSQSFDAYDRMSSHTNADGYVLQYRYDPNGNLTHLIYPGNRTVTYAYDSLNRLTNVTDWVSRQTAIEYDVASRVRKITRPNGTFRELHYDAAGQTTNIVEKMAIGVPIAFFKLNWNAAARVEWEFAAPLPHAYTPPTRTMTFDDDNRLATFNGQNVVHDIDGNMTSGPLTNNTLVTHSYDARNRLSSAGSLSYGYDPAGSRTSITNGGNVTRFVVNPNAALSQVLMRVRPGVTNYYIYGLGLLYEITETATSTNTATYHYDYRGSTVALTDANGIPTDRIEYSAYATTTYRTGTNDTPFLYNGRYGVQTDPNGLLHMRARYYNPHLCRFLNSDPAGFSGGLNFYAYADGNPISMIDPFGLGAIESGGRSWIMTPSSVGGWLFDQAFDLAASVTGFGFEALGSGLDVIGAGLGNPYLGEGLRSYGQDFYNMQSPAAAAGYYDPSHPGTTFAAAATVFVSPQRAGNQLATKIATTTFQGMEVRAVRNLSHVDDATLRAMSKRGFAPDTVNGDQIVLHHLNQNPAGPLVEMPRANHSIWNPRQHPFGNTPGAGLTAEQRAAFDAWRVEYWKSRAQQELTGRAGGQ